MKSGKKQVLIIMSLLAGISVYCLYLFAIYQGVVITVKNDNYEATKTLLSLGANPNANGLFSGPILNIAIRNGNFRLTKLLIANGADCNQGTINTTTFYPESPLLVAVSCRRSDIVELLITAGADVNKWVMIISPLIECAAQSDCDTGIMRLLLNSGATVNDSHPEFMESPLMVASRKKNGAGISVLLDHGAAVDAQSKSGETALMYAVREGYYEGVKILLESGANTAIRNYDNLTAFEIAKLGNQEEIAELLNKWNHSGNDLKGRIQTTGDERSLFRGAQ